MLYQKLKFKGKVKCTVNGSDFYGTVCENSYDHVMINLYTTEFGIWEWARTCRTVSFRLDSKVFGTIEEIKEFPESGKEMATLSKPIENYTEENKLTNPELKWAMQFGTNHVVSKDVEGGYSAKALVSVIGKRIRFKDETMSGFYASTRDAVVEATRFMNKQ